MVHKTTRPCCKERPVLYNISVIILVLLSVAALPQWRHSANWGYSPSGSLGLLTALLLTLLMSGQL
jgi:hypothetical protein